MREWRNWQTRWLQVPVLARVWGFKSPLAHTQTEEQVREKVSPFSDSMIRVRPSGRFFSCWAFTVRVAAPADQLADALLHAAISGPRYERGDEDILTVAGVFNYL